MLRSRASMVLFLFVVLVLVILAQNGALNDLFASFGLNKQSGSTYAPPALFATNAPSLFETPMPGSGFVIPTAYAPTAFMAPIGQPIYSPTNPSVVINSGATAVPIGAVAADGQCIVPNGWVPYTIQSGDTLAIIGANYNLTGDQIAAANCLSNPDLVYEGQLIAVPPQLYAQ